MKLIKNLSTSLFKLTLSYKIILFIKTLIGYASDYEYISESFYSTGFKDLVRSYLNVELNRDWIGRLYGVINPIIDIEGKLNVSNMIIEIDDERTNNSENVKNWIYKQLQLVSELFKIQNLYNFITLELRPVGPKGYDNYLIIFDMAARRDLAYAFKKMAIQALTYTIIGLGIYFFIL